MPSNTVTNIDHIGDLQEDPRHQLPWPKDRQVKATECPADCAGPDPTEVPAVALSTINGVDLDRFLRAAQKDETVPAWFTSWMNEVHETIDRQASMIRALVELGRAHGVTQSVTLDIVTATNDMIKARAVRDAI